MMHKVAGEVVLALLLLNVTQTNTTLFMPTFVKAAMPHYEGVAFGVQTAHLPQAGERMRVPKKTDLTAVGVVTTAQSVTVFDGESGALLYAEEPDVVRAIGSISKLMTAMVFLDTNPDLASWVTVKKDAYVGGGRVYVTYDDPLMLGDVLSASLIGSDNTATEALVGFSGISREEFLTRMNAKAGEFGLQATAFVDPSGLSAENQSTAREVGALLARARAYKEIVARTQKSETTIVHRSGKRVTVPSTNMLVNSSFVGSGFPMLIGKTGFIPQAGYCFAGAFVHDGHTLYTTVLGASSKDARFTDAANVTDWVTKVYTWPAL